MRVRASWIVLLGLLVIASPVLAQDDDEYLTKLYLSLNDSPMQRKLRALKPFPVGVVLYQQRNQGLESLRRDLRTIRETGFDSLKQLQIMWGEEAQRTAFIEKVMNVALDEGVYPWYYGLGGWEPITDELLRALGIPPGTPPAEVQAHPKMLAHQVAILRKRIANAKNVPPLATYAKKGEPGRGHPFFKASLQPLFAAWLEKHYGRIEAVRDAWNVAGVEGPGLTTFSQAAGLLVGDNTSRPAWDFRRYRDSMRFQADLAADDYDRLMKHHLKHEPWEPVRTGGHHLFDNQALNGWDLEAQARAAAQGGSFYSSVHLAHHFREVAGEVDRPVYLQSRIIADSFKGGWAAVWESTGGPTQWSGYNSFNVDAGVMTRLMLSYVGAGLKGVGIWTWSSRDLGWEGGEYALTDLLGRPTDRARAAGAIARALQKHRFELWDAHGEPLVGVMFSWESDATYGRLGLGFSAAHRASQYQKVGPHARIGIGRALMNANVPFEYVTERDLRVGLAGRYKSIYLPAVMTLPRDAMAALTKYVRAGGRVVADMPLLMYDENGRLMDTRPGSAFEALFGVSVADYQNAVNAPRRLEGVALSGQWAELEPTKARVTARFEDGKPAVLENALEKGKVVLLNGELAHMAKAPGRRDVEAALVRHALGPLKPRWRADGVLAYRRAAPNADHYFLVNEGEARAVTIAVSDRTYTRTEDGVTGAAIAGRGRSIRVPVPARSGRWVRVEKGK